MINKRKPLGIILFLFVLLLINCSLYSQYQIIYTAPVNRSINNFASFPNKYNNNLSVYLSLSGDAVTAGAPFWLRYFRSGNMWQSNPHGTFLSGFTCFNGQGGYQWSYTKFFVRSNSDTNLIISRYDWLSCNPVEAGYYNNKTTNSGTSFQQLPSIGLNGFDIDPVNDSLIYGAGCANLGSGNIWRTTDKGSNWISSAIGGSQQDNFITKINPLKRNEIYIIKNNQFYKSTDYGISFINTGTLPAYPSGILTDVVDTSIYFFSTNSGIYKSVNNGLNFLQKFPMPVTSMLINPDNHNILYAGVSNNGLYLSSDAGNTWVRYFDNFTGSLSITGLVKYKNDLDTIYAANNLSVYKIWAPLVGITQAGMEIPVKSELFQNYPNPFNPSTNISFLLPNGGYVKLVVYDETGRVAVTLVNENLKEGIYKVDWNASDYPSGIYFYKLTTGDYVSTKKMVLMK